MLAARTENPAHADGGGEIVQKEQERDPFTDLRLLLNIPLQNVTWVLRYY